MKHTKKYGCLLHAVEYCQPVTDDAAGLATQTPYKMYGTFQYDNHEPFEFLVIFDPMGGCWTLIRIKGRWKGLSRQNEWRYDHIADSAMAIAEGNRSAEAPEDFKWELYHDEETTRA